MTDQPAVVATAAITSDGITTYGITTISPSAMRVATYHLSGWTPTVYAPAGSRVVGCAFDAAAATPIVVVEQPADRYDTSTLWTFAVLASGSDIPAGAIYVGSYTPTTDPYPMPRHVYLLSQP